MAFKKGIPGTVVDRDWSEDKLDDVATGIFQALGLFPMRAASKLAQYAGGEQAPTTAIPEGPYVKLGRQVVDTLRACHAQGLKSPVTGGALVDPSNFGWLVVGKEQSALASLGNAAMEVAETVTGGLVSADDGGMDAAAMAALVKIGSALTGG